MLDFNLTNESEFTLENTYNDCWERIYAGSKSAKHSFHLVTLSTIDVNEPAIRTVVLREVNPIEKTLNIHTDYRSPKVKQIQDNPMVAILLYDFESRIQIRLKAKATVHYKDDVCKNAWNKSRLESKRCYLAMSSPSSRIDFPDDGLPKNLSVKDLTEDNVQPGFENFVVIKSIVTELDWLYLNHKGHRRALYKISNTDLEMNWILP
jgi:pyridoxamine 5'-phosphate oxidase